jgi:hypothetical protein
MQEDEVLVSEPKSKIVSIIGVSIGVVGFLFLYSQIIVAASWIGFIISMILYVAVMSFLSSCFSKIYYFSDKNIVVADHKNEYIGEMECNNLVSWNEYVETQKGKKYHTIIIQNDERKIIMPKEVYKNYDEILGYFERKKFRKDIDLDDSFPKKGIEGFYSNWDDKIGATTILSGIGLLLLFWFIISFKNDTGKKLVFTGRIENLKITKGKNRNYYIQLDNYPFDFRLKKSGDIDYFSENYNYYNGSKVSIHKGKKIKIGISKDYYDWKTKNEFIKFLDISDGKTWDVEQYEMLEN